MSPSAYGFNKILALSALTLAGVAAQAQVVISFNVTPQTSQFGYNTGSNYTFSFTTAASFGLTPDSHFNSIANVWDEEHLDDDQLYTAVSGDGLVGSYTRPAMDYIDPFSILSTSQPALGFSALDVSAGADVSDIGLTTAFGQLSVYRIAASIPNTTANFSYPGVYSQPNGILEAAAGIYFPSGGTLDLFTVEGNLPFSVNSFTITPPTSEVPFGVDSTTGLAVLGLSSAWKLRRRNRS